MKIFLIACFTLSIIHIDIVYSEDLTQELMNKVSIDSLMNSVEELSGQKRILVNGIDTIIQKRRFNTIGNVLASQYLFEKGNLRKYEISYQKCSETACENVIMERKGKLDSNSIIIIGAHYDSDNFDDYKGQTEFLSPGADDNASGCSSVMEIARILENYEPDYTLQFIFWDEEEIGSTGAKFYAEKAKEFNQNILFYLNLDMLAWDENDDGKVELKYIDIANSLFYADSIVNICKQNNLNLEPEKITMHGSYFGFTGDADWFWYRGYSAIALSDFLDYMEAYHSQFDLPKYFNKDYFLENTKLALAILLNFAYNSTITNVGQNNPDEKVLSIFPNPSNEFIQLSYGSNSDIEIYNTLGMKMGNYTINNYGKRIDVSNFPSGLYFIRINDKISSFVKF